MAARKTKKKEHPWPATEIVKRQVASLVPYARNARKHSKAQVAKIAASITEWGWTMPVLIDEDGGVIAGHGRILAAQTLSIDEVPCVIARGWSEAQKRAYVIADNQLTLDAGWDRDLLAIEFDDLNELDFDLGLTGFDELAIKSLLQHGDELSNDITPEKPDNPVTRAGDMWLLGEHRLLCGDATDAKDVGRVLAGDVPRLMVTDPPYGVEYDPAWRKEAGVNKTKRVGKVQNDDCADWTEAWKLFPGDVAYVWHGGKHAGVVQASLESCDLEVRGQIIWNKGGSWAISRGAYHWQHEPCWYVVRKGAKAHWIGDRKQTTVWDIQSVLAGNEDSDTLHGTQKPLECMGRPMRHHDAPLVFDPFMGSGTTLVAAELQDRRCLGLDLDPSYVDVALLRWQQHSSQLATLDGDGRTFEAIAKERSKPARKKAKKKTKRSH